MEVARSEDQQSLVDSTMEGLVDGSSVSAGQRLLPLRVLRCRWSKIAVVKLRKPLLACGLVRMYAVLGATAGPRLIFDPGGQE